MNKVGRNKLCPCGSGRKYKICHMRVFEPKEKFSVKITHGNKSPNYHLESQDEGKTWIKKMGKMPVQFRIHARTFWYEDIDKVIDPLAKKIPKEKQFLITRVNRLRHKLYGMKYHFENFKNQEDIMISGFNADYEGLNHELVLMEPKLTYELESFLFQIKSALDVLAQIIGITYGFSITSYSENGEKVIRSLKQNSPKELKNHASTLIKIIESRKNWVLDIVDMRDDVTHYSDLEGFSCFIQHPWNGGNTTEISYPSMPDGIRARKFMEKTFNDMLNFLQEISLHIVI